MMRYTQIHPFRLSRENRLLFEGAETFSPQNPEKMKVEKKTLKSLDSLKSKVAESAAEFARNRLNFPTVEEYHNAVLLKNGQEENLDQHWGRAILNPNDGKPRRLIVMISGNNEPLTQKKDRYQSYRGTMYLFDQMSGMNMKDTDVLQLKVGEAVIPFRENPPPGRQSEAAMAHIQNLIDDALAGKGAFAGRTYDKVNMYGFSVTAQAPSITSSKDWRAARRPEKPFRPSTVRSMSTAYASEVRARRSMKRRRFPRATITSIRRTAHS